MEDKLTAAEMDIKVEQFRFIESPPVAGRYQMFPGTFLEVLEPKPNRFHRWMTRLLLGWKWEDN